MTSTVFTLPGAFGEQSTMPLMLQGAITAGNVIIPINYPNWTASYWPNSSINESQVNQTTCVCEDIPPNVAFGNSNIEVGACMLNKSLLATTGQKIVLAHDLGCVVATRWLMEYGLTSSVSPDELTFVLLGNSIRALGGYVYVTAGAVSAAWAGEVGISSDNPYSVLDIARQFDGQADWPDTDTNFGDWSTACMNAQIGMNTLHNFYQDVSLTDPLNGYYKVNNVTYVINPTPLLPMANQWFYSPALQQQMDTKYRPGIYNAYSYYSDFSVNGLVEDAAVVNLGNYLPSFAPPMVPVFPPPEQNNLATVDRRNYDALMKPIELSAQPGTPQPTPPAAPTATDIAVQIYTSVFNAPAVPANIVNHGNGTFTMTFGDDASGPPNGGMFVLSYGNSTTGPIIFSSTGFIMALAMETALWALPDVGWFGVTVTATTNSDFTFQFATPSGNYGLAIGDNAGSPSADPAGLSGDITNLIQQGEDYINNFLQGFFGIPGVGGYSTAIEI